MFRNKKHLTHEKRGSISAGMSAVRHSKIDDIRFEMGGQLSP